MAMDEPAWSGKKRQCLPALLSGALLLLGACAGAPVETIVAPVQPLPWLELVAVYPVALRWQASAEESYRKTNDLIAALGAGTGVDLLVPREIVVDDGESTALTSASNALHVAHELGYPPAVVGLVRMRLEQRLQQGTRQVYDLAGRPRGARAEQVLTYIVHGELWQLLPTRLLAAFRAGGMHDPFAEHPDWDGQPVLRRLVELVGGQIARVLAAASSPRAACPIDPGFSFHTNPVAVLEHPDPGKATLREELTRLDSLEQELRLWRAFQYFRPTITSAQAQRLARLPQGVVVAEVGPRAAQTGLRAGDLIVAVGERPIACAAQLRRELRRQQSPVLVVRRGGDEQRIAWK